MKNFLLITAGQPSVNPRIVKEANALHAAGFGVTVLYCYFIDWATRSDEILLKGVKWEYKMVGGSPFHNKTLYLFTKLRFKMARVLNRYLGNNFLIAERSQARCYDELLKAARSIKADWYIGHNLGALSVCINAAKFHKAKTGFDFEDYHREENDNSPRYEKKRIEFLENKYVPFLDHISAASPMIAKRVAVNFPPQNNKIITLLNCFPLSQQPAFREKAENDHSLKLFWFSQTIGTDRGLEILIDALVELNDPSIHLTLAGNCNNDFKSYLDKYAKDIRHQVHLTGTVPPVELLSLAASFDVGLALELTDPENRNICLTNKIFTYLLAGNAIILSATSMQSAFNERYKFGESFPVNDVEGLVQAIKFYQNREKLDQQRSYNYSLAKRELNWENESEKLVSLFNQPDLKNEF